MLRVDKIAMKEWWRDRLFAGQGIPRLPTDYGFRDNAYFLLPSGVVALLAT